MSVSIKPKPITPGASKFGKRLAAGLKKKISFTAKVTGKSPALMLAMKLKKDNGNNDSATRKSEIMNSDRNSDLAKSHNTSNRSYGR